MEYKNAVEILPPDLLEQVQKYFDGGTIYIPKSSRKAKWGELSGIRNDIRHRNVEIVKLFKKGKTISELADEYFLSIETIKKIVYCSKYKIV